MEAVNNVSTTTTTQDIVDTFLAAGDFKTLSNALKAADLVGTLKSAGPYTVFAPTDEAFKKLPTGTIEDLLKDKVKLTSILNHHIISGKFMAKDVKSGDTKTANGDMLNVATSSEGVTVDNAKITTPDIDATNGVIHSIDKLVLPQ
ncbi:MAG: fasciclin domain-containing protein [Gammaproteobacteria bacterium]